MHTGNKNLIGLRWYVKIGLLILRGIECYYYEVQLSIMKIEQPLIEAIGELQQLDQHEGRIMNITVIILQLQSLYKIQQIKYIGTSDHIQILCWWIHLELNTGKIRIYEHLMYLIIDEVIIRMLLMRSLNF